MATIEQAVAGGISFALTDEQKALRELARDFATNEIRPKAAEYDEHQTHPADIVEKAHDLGLMNVHVPEEYGGLGLRRRRDEDDRGPQRRRVRPQRLEDVHHERRPRSVDGRVREDRPVEGSPRQDRK